MDLLNTALGDMGDVYHKSGVATVSKVLKLKSFPCDDNNREHTAAKGSSNHPVCDWFYLELSSYASVGKQLQILVLKL